MGVNIRITSGPAIAKTGDLAALLTNLQPGDILFIDEIHRLDRSIEEILYPAMEDFAIDIIVGKGPSANSIRLELPQVHTDRRDDPGGPALQPLCGTGSASRCGWSCIRRRSLAADRDPLCHACLAVEIDPDGAREIAKPGSRGTSSDRQPDAAPGAGFCPDLL